MSDFSRFTRRDVTKLLGAGVAFSGGLGLTGTAAAASPSGGDDAYWTTGEQYGFGTVADHDEEDQSRAWFTLTEGAVAQARFPRIDLINLRTLDFVVADTDGDYAKRTFNADRTDDDEETLDRRVEPTADDALLFRHVFEETDGDQGWTLTAEYATHPDHDAVLADVRFEADGGPYDVYVLADPSVSMSGLSDEAVVRSVGGPSASGNGGGNGGGDRYALAAVDTEANDDAAVILDPSEGEDSQGEAYNVALSLASERGFDWASVDVVGGDVWSSLLSSGTAADRFDEASGNVALVGRLRASTTGFEGEVGVGFAEEMDVAAAVAEAQTALKPPFRAVRNAYRGSWRDYLDDLSVPDAVAGDDELAAQYAVSAMALKAADSKRFPGAGVASPSVPWGEAVEANTPADYGYNFVWSRDLYQAFTAFEAMGDVDSAVAAVEYLYGYQQEESGFLPQNTFLDGRTRWGGEQMDNISFPQLMAYQLWNRHDVGFDDVGYDYENVRRSADYVVANGPATGQERWEEEGGLSPSTTAAEIAGLVAASELAAATDHRGDALVYLGLADRWQANTEEWMATTSELVDSEGEYYVRVNDDTDPDDGATVTINNGGPTIDERSVIDAGFLELVRLGVKPWDDPVVRSSLDVVDDTIRVETPHGPAWYRYNEDGYGEQADNPEDDYPEGAPWALDNAGAGRLWPIFDGERGEYELLADDTAESVAPEDLLRTMRGFANDGRMIPEQVWDREYPTEFGWEFGEGTGSATPLSWSMAQFVRLAQSLDAGGPVERPAATTARYVEGEPPEGPSLDVSFPADVVESDTVTVSGSTDGDELAVKTNAETVHVADAGGSFSVDIAVAEGETAVTVVAAAGGDDVAGVGTTAAQKTVAYPALGERLASWDDPEGDDAGPGSYTYPTASEFVPGAFDIVEFGVYETDERYQFFTSIAGELTNPWGGNAIALQTLQVYLRDPSAGGGSTEARTGVNATFEEPYQYRVFAEGFVPAVLERSDGSTVTSDVTIDAYTSIDAFTVSVPKSAFDAPLSTFELVPLLLGQDGSGTGRIRSVDAEAAPYAFGGGEDDGNDPNVIDVVTPEGVTNADALAYSADAEAAIPYLSLSGSE